MKYLVKQIQRFLQDRKAVTPVVGVILMVAVTVVMGAVIAGFVYGYVGSTEQGPLLGLSVEDDPADSVSLILKHTGGEPMVEGDWKLSVTPGKDSSTKLDYASLISGTVITEADAALSAGTTLTINDETDGLGTATGDALDETPGWYHVVVIHEPSSSLLMDTNVQVR